MCGIAGVLSLSRKCIPDVSQQLAVMNFLQRHRGPDGEGTWKHPDKILGLAHRRLSIIDLSPAGAQPMTDRQGNWITYTGEIYNYVELREELGRELFISNSDTEVILMAYRRWGKDCLHHLRGMFAFALWDDHRQILLCARDRLVSSRFIIP
jgi:asparagine synthase (glutamine-hydrolysing)